MQAKLNNSSIVIVANAHNPTVISDSFFIKSGIISSENEINRSATIITPAFSQVSLNNSTNLLIEPGKLLAQSVSGDRHYQIAQAYCKALPYINCTAIGINISYDLSGSDFITWFSEFDKFKYNNGEMQSLKYAFSNQEKNICIIEVVKTGINDGNVLFNFHYQLNSMLLGDLDKKYNFLQEAKLNNNIAVDFIATVLHTHLIK